MKFIRSLVALFAVLQLVSNAQAFLGIHTDGYRDDRYYGRGYYDRGYHGWRQDRNWRDRGYNYPYGRGYATDVAVGTAANITGGVVGGIAAGAAADDYRSNPNLYRSPYYNR